MERFPIDVGGKRTVSALLVEPSEPIACYVFAHGSVEARSPKLTIIAGGKSFGGRMTSQAQASSPMPGISGLAFLGFPLHPAAKPSTDRAAHLDDVSIPMLFLQGNRDKLAEPALIRAVSRKLGARTTLHVVEAADQSFHVSAKSCRTDDEVISEIVGLTADWVNRIGNHHSHNGEVSATPCL